MPKKKDDDSNIFNDLFHGVAEALPERKQRAEKKLELEEMDEEAKLLEDKKRARYEAIKAKYKE